MTTTSPVVSSDNYGWPCFSIPSEEFGPVGATGAFSDSSYLPTFTMVTPLPAPTVVSFGCTGLTVNASPTQVTINGLVSLQYSQPPKQSYPGPLSYSFNLPPGNEAFYMLKDTSIGRIRGQPVSVSVALGGNLTSAVVTILANFWNTSVPIRTWLRFTYSLYGVETHGYSMTPEGNTFLLREDNFFPLLKSPSQDGGFNPDPPEPRSGLLEMPFARRRAFPKVPNLSEGFNSGGSPPISGVNQESGDTTKDLGDS